MHLKSEAFCEILKSDDLNVENEEMVFDSVRFWLTFNKLDRETHLKPLLGVVRLSLLSTKVIIFTSMNRFNTLLLTYMFMSVVSIYLTK